MKLIFLDFDGVLNSDIYFNSEVFKKDTKGMSSAEIMLLSHHTHVDPAALQILNQLVEKSGAKVVVSSTWRIMYSINDLNFILKSRGATFEIIAATPKYSDYVDTKIYGRIPTPRGNEIQGYLNSLDEEPESFVILDDVNNMAHLTKFLILTNNYYGLTVKNLEEALTILKVE